MRTTLTLDEDVAAKISQIRSKEKVSLKTLVNDALRTGLEEYLDGNTKPSVPYKLKPVRLGARLPAIDDVADILSSYESESFR